MALQPQAMAALFKRMTYFDWSFDSAG
jgi:hypothetical protein